MHAGFELDLADEYFPLRLNYQFIMQNNCVPKADIFASQAIRNPVRNERKKLNYFPSNKELAQTEKKHAAARVGNDR